MALPLSAKCALLGLLIIVTADTTLGDSGCACEVRCAQIVAEHRREIARLEDEVRALRGARRTTAPEVQCDADWVVTSDAEVDVLQGCRTVRTLTIQGGQHVTSLVALGSLEAAENVLIQGNLKLKSLAGLEKLARVGQRLLVEDNARLPSLLGLQGLHTAGEINIVKNSKLSDLSGLEGLRTVENVTVKLNNALNSLQGLQGVRSTRELDIEGNSALADLAGLENLVTLQELRIAGTRSLKTLAGLESLTSVSTKLTLKSNGDLRSLEGLQGLRVVKEMHLLSCIELESLAALEHLTHLNVLFLLEMWKLKDLTGLGNLSTVDDMTIKGCSDLQDLTGLENLQTVDKLTLDRNLKLQSLTALKSLTRVNVLLINDCGSLQSLSGLEGLTRVDELNLTSLLDFRKSVPTLNGLESLTTVSVGLTIQGLPSLSSLSGLQGLRTTGRLRIEDNKNLVTLSGLENLESVRGELSIKKLPKLQLLDGLESLTSVETLTLEELDELCSIAGLRKLTSVQSQVFIHAWPKLRSLEGLGALQDAGSLVVVDSQLEYLGGPFASGAEIKEVHIDKWPPCLTAQEHVALLSVVSLISTSSLPQQLLWPQWQPRCNRASFGTFLCTRGHRCSFSLPGKGSNYTSVFMSDRFTGCGLCTDDRVRGEVTGGDMVDLGYALKGQEGGLRSICRCAGAAKLGPVAQLLLRGPRQSSRTVCTRGLNCTLELDGEDLKSADRVVLMSNCAGNPLSGFAASWIAEKVYLLHDPATWHKAPPALYQVCWRAPCSFSGDGPTCPAPEDSYIHISDVELKGSFSRRYTFVLGEDLVAANIGRGVADGDWMRILRICGEANAEGTGVSANSSGQLFDFGRPTEENLWPGSYHLCWCQGGPGVECDADRDFATESGTVRILCPAGQEPAGGSGRCQACPAGRQQLEPGLEPCSACPAGHSSLGGSAKCEVCQDGTVAEGTGSPACTACRAWESAGAQATGCFPDPAMLVLLASFYLSVGTVCATLVRTVQRRLPVVDVSLDQKCTVITTFGPHGFHDFGRPSFPVSLRDSGHPGLDKPSEPFRVRVRDAARLELVTQSGESIDRRLDTSMGTLVAAFPHDLYHQGWPVSMALYMPALFITVLALGGLVLGMGLVLEGLVGAAAVALGFTAASVALRWRPRITPLARRVSEFKQKLAKRPSRCCEKGPERAIAIGKLYELLDFFRDHIRDRSAYYLDSNILRPLTKEKEISYAELVGAEPVDWFVSHFWGTAFEHFCTALQKHAQTVCGQHTWSTLCYWVCFCSNNQHRIKEELGQGWEDSSFYLTLKNGRCRGTCMVLDDQALPLTRVWCIFELLQTIKLQASEESFQGLLLCTSGGVLNTGKGSVEVAIALAEKVAQMDLRAAQASSESDAKMIREQVVTEMGSYSALNHFIRGEVGNMLVRAQSSANQHFAAVLQHLSVDAAGNQVAV